MKHLIIALIASSIFACNEKVKEESTKSCCHKGSEDSLSCSSSYIDTLKSEIMTIHDEVMPQTGHLMKLRNSLKEQLSTDSSKNKSSQLTIDSLKLAHDKMMEWMQDYNVSHEVSDTIYFLNQKENVTIINELYGKAIYSAEQKLKQ